MPRPLFVNVAVHRWKMFRILSLLLLCQIASPLKAQMRDELPPAECQANDDRIMVLLLASYHMANPGLDRFNLMADDVTMPKRQEEIQELVKRLAAFKPSKIAVESPFSDSAAAKNYQQYLQGERELKRNEGEQIGFRLAKLLGHAQVYPIDVSLKLDDSKLGGLIAADPKLQARMGELQQFGQAAMAQMSKWLSEETISEMLYQMNRPEMLAQAHWPYVWIIAPIAQGDNYGGADMVADWYKRNLRIFANINRIAEPGDRILIIYGQGHIPILRELVGASPRFCRVDPLPYLLRKEKR
jgi:hypothetical protein